MDWLVAHSKVEKREVDNEHPVSGFLFDFAHMCETGMLIQGTDYVVFEGDLFIRLRNVQHIHSQYTRTHGLPPPLNEKTLRHYLAKEPYFVSHDARQYVGTTRVRTTQLKISEITKLHGEIMPVKGEF